MSEEEKSPKFGDIVCICGDCGYYIINGKCDKCGREERID